MNTTNMKIFSQIEGAPKPIGPYSIAVVANGMAYCAGQIGLDPKTGAIVSGGVEQQAEQVLKNLAVVLESIGSSFRKAVMTSVFLTDISQGKVVNEIYGRYVSPDAPPARQTVVVKDLPLGALVEISVVAVV